MSAFIEFKNMECKFKNCKHLNELGCSIKNNKIILNSRYENYLKFIEE